MLFLKFLLAYILAYLIGLFIENDRMITIQNKARFTYALLLGCSMVINLYIFNQINPGIKILSIVMISAIITQNLYKTTFFQSIISICKVYIAIEIADVLTVYFLVHRLHFKLSDIVTNPYSIIFSSLLCYLFIGFSILIIKIFKNIKKKYTVQNIYSKLKLITLIYIFSALILISIYSFSISHYIEEVDKEIATANIYILALFFILNFIVVVISEIIIKKSQNLQYKEQENKTLQMYVHSVEELLTGKERERHNYLNILHVLNGYVQNNDFEGLKQTLELLINKNKTLNSSKAILSNNKIKDSALKSLLSTKISNAESLNINIHLEVLSEIENLSIKTMDLCEVIGIYLDNAIEAASEAEIKKINIELLELDEHVSIIIENTYLEEPEINKLYQKGISTKQGNNRGIGLWLSNKILSQYQNVYHNTFIRDGVFVQELHIKTLNNSI